MLLFGKKKKTVQWALERNIVYETYSPSDYDRHSIDSVMYLKAYNRLSNYEWVSIFKDLNLYKKYEMLVHYESVRNTNLHEL